MRRTAAPISSGCSTSIDRCSTPPLRLNTDAGGVDLSPDGRPEFFAMQTAEKIYASFALEASSPGGHSSRPTPDNAIYGLARRAGRGSSSIAFRAT